MHFAGVNLTDAVKMAVHHPAKLLGLDPGGLVPGGPADLVQFDLAEPSQPDGPRQFRVRSTILDGRLVYGAAWQPSSFV